MITLCSFICKFYAFWEKQICPFVFHVHACHWVSLDLVQLLSWCKLEEKKRTCQEACFESIQVAHTNSHSCYLHHAPLPHPMPPSVCSTAKLLGPQGAVWTVGQTVANCGGTWMGWLIYVLFSFCMHTRSYTGETVSLAVWIQLLFYHAPLLAIVRIIQ